MPAPEDAAVGSFETPTGSPATTQEPAPSPASEKEKKATAYVIFECIAHASQGDAFGPGSRWVRYPELHAHGNEAARQIAATKLYAQRAGTDAEGQVGAIVAVPAASVKPEEYEPTSGVRRRKR